MSVPTGAPAPRRNLTRAGISDLVSDIASTDILVATGDYTGGTPDDEFNATAHGLNNGDYLFLLYKAVAGVLTVQVGTRVRADIVDANSFQVTTDDGTLIENTADGVAVFLKANQSTPSIVVELILSRLIVATGDFEGGTTDDMFTPEPETGFHGLEDTNTLKLVYEAAAGVVTGNVDVTYFAKSVTGAAFELAATSGGADITNSADGLAIFLLTT